MAGRDSDIDVDAEALGRALAAMRAEQGLRRRDLHERSGLSYPYISEIENGAKQPSMTALAKLAAALGATPAELLERAEVLSGPRQPRWEMRLASEPSPASAVDRGMETRGSRWFHAEQGATGRSGARPSAEPRVADLTVPELEDLIRRVVREELAGD